MLGRLAKSIGAAILRFDWLNFVVDASGDYGCLTALAEWKQMKACEIDSRDDGSVG